MIVLANVGRDAMRQMVEMLESNGLIGCDVRSVVFLPDAGNDVATNIRCGIAGL